MADNLPPDPENGTDGSADQTEPEPLTLQQARARHKLAVAQWRCAKGGPEETRLRQARDQAEALLRQIESLEADNDSSDGGDSRAQLNPVVFDEAVGSIGFMVRWNMLSYQYEAAEMDGSDPKPWDWAELDDRAAARLIEWLLDGGGLGSGLTTERFWRLLACVAPAVDPMADWLSSLPRWDGVDRLDTLMARCFLTSQVSGSPEERLAAAAPYCILGACIQRTASPGCQMDDLWILASDTQGQGKSSFVSALVPEWAGPRGWVTADLSIAVTGSKDAVDQIMGSVLVEIADMAGARAAEWDAFKAFVTKRSDTFRLAYDRRRTVIPRRAVFVGTSDRLSLGPLQKDSAGSRRFRLIPIYGGHHRNRTDQAKHVRDTIAADREQLWAEAVARHRRGEPYWLAQDDLDRAADDLAAASHHHTTIEEAVLERDAASFDGMRLIEIAEELNVGARDADGKLQHPTRAEQHEIVEALKAQGMRPVQRRQDGKTRRVWTTL